MRIAIFSVILMAFSPISMPAFAALESKVCEEASAQLPMARKGQIKDPSVLAKAIEVSLAEDPSGNGKIKGAYISPNGILAAVKGAGGEVDGMLALTIYLRSLIPGEMPSGKITMSRVTYKKVKKGKDCIESYALDLKKGFTREARKGEVGWYDPGTNRLILAGDCSNSPLSPIQGPKAEPKSEPKQVVVAEKPSQCVGEKYTKPIIGVYGWGKEALEVPGVRAAIAATTIGDFESPDSLSRKYGAAIRACKKAGDCPKSTLRKKIVVSYIKTDKQSLIIKEEPIRTLTLKGYKRVEVHDLRNWHGVRVVVSVEGNPDAELSSPKRSGSTGKQELRSFPWEWDSPRKCLKWVHIIDPEN